VTDAASGEKWWWDTSYGQLPLSSWSSCCSKRLWVLFFFFKLKKGVWVLCRTPKIANGCTAIVLCDPVLCLQQRLVMGHTTMASV